MTLDDYVRLAPGQRLIGVVKPAYQSVAGFGMFLLPTDVEVFKHQDHGLSIGGNYVSSLQNERGCFLCLVPKGCDYNTRETIEMNKLAELVGFALDEIQIRLDAF